MWESDEKNRKTNEHGRAFCFSSGDEGERGEGEVVTVDLRLSPLRVCGRVRMPVCDFQPRATLQGNSPLPGPERWGRFSCRPWSLHSGRLLRSMQQQQQQQQPPACLRFMDVTPSGNAQWSELLTMTASISRGAPVRVCARGGVRRMSRW